MREIDIKQKRNKAYAKYALPINNNLIKIVLFSTKRGKRREKWNKKKEKRIKIGLV